MSKICPQCGASNSICSWHCWQCGYPPVGKIVDALRELPLDDPFRKRILPIREGDTE